MHESIERYPVVIYIPGVWDLFHYGHATLIQKTQQISPDGPLFIGVVSDEGAVLYKKEKPIMTTCERMKLLGILYGFEKVWIQKTTDPTDNLKELREKFPNNPILLVHGSDWTKLLKGEDALLKYNIGFLRLSYTTGISSSDLKNRFMEPPRENPEL